MLDRPSGSQNMDKRNGSLTLTPRSGQDEEKRNQKKLESKEAFRILQEMSKILNTGLDDKALGHCVRLCERGVDPHALAHLIKHWRKGKTSSISSASSASPNTSSHYKHQNGN